MPQHYYDLLKAVRSLANVVWPTQRVLFKKLQPILTFYSLFNAYVMTKIHMSIPVMSCLPRKLQGACIVLRPGTRVESRLFL